MPANTANRLLGVPTVDDGSSCSDDVVAEEPEILAGIIANTNNSGTTSCMGVDNAVNGGIVKAVACDSNAPHWSYRTDGRIGYGEEGDETTLCLDTDLGHPYSNNQLKLYFCHGLSGNQAFSWESPGLVSLNQNGYCINNNGIGEQMTTLGCDAANHSFEMIKTSGKIELVSSESNQCLGLNGVANGGTGVTTVDCANAPHWKVSDVTQLINQQPQRMLLVDDNVDVCLDNDTGNPYYGHLAAVYFCWGTSVNQMWYWLNDGRIVLQQKNQCLAPASTPAVNGEQAVVTGCNAATQAWKFK